MTEAKATLALLRLAAWLSPSFPVGAYSYSHGVEAAVEAGMVHDRATLGQWVATIVRDGCGRLDAALFIAAHRAAADQDQAALAAVVEQADARRSTAELALESTAQGRAFLDAVRAVWPEPRLDAWARTMAAERRHPGHAVTVAVVCAVHGLALVPALPLYLQAFAANLVSAGVRLIPLGQTDGQRIVAALEPVIDHAAAAALARPANDFATATPMVDWTSCRHETQYARLFRS